MQIADILASSLTYAAKNAQKDKHAQNWISKIFQEPYISCAVAPDIERFSDKRERACQLLILIELLDRSKNGKSLVEKLPELIYRCRLQAMLFP